MKKIIVDTLGGDNGSNPIVKGALRAMEENTDLELVFVGIRKDIEKIINQTNACADKIEIVETDEFVPDDAPPTCVFKGADNTSMVMALERLKTDCEIMGMISSGNTGALLVGTICHLGLIDGLHSPALATALPCKKNGYVCLVDCGANAECTPNDLKRYAIMGNAFMQSFTGEEKPKIALMSVGRTKHKGTPLVKEAYELIEKLPLNFIGNIEGNDLVNSEADVIVTDGFTGNVLLKNTESAGMAALEIVNELGKNLPEYENIKSEIYKRFAFNDRGGATFLGTKKTVVKMHGCANEYTAYACVNQLLSLESRNFSEKIASALKQQ